MKSGDLSGASAASAACIAYGFMLGVVLDDSVCTAPPCTMHRRQWQDAAHGHEGAAALLAENAAEEAAAAAALKLRRVSPTHDFQSEGSSERFPGSASPRTEASPQSTSARDRSPGTDVKLYHRAVVVAQDPGALPFVCATSTWECPHGHVHMGMSTWECPWECPHTNVTVRLLRHVSNKRHVLKCSHKNRGAHHHTGSAVRGMVRQLSIDQFENESRRVSMGTDSVGRARTPMFDRLPSMPGVHKLVLRELLHPRTWRPPEDRSFVLSAEQIVQLCNDAEKLISEEPTVLQLHAPIKIFGDLHGQFGDLMRLFEEYGTPSTAGDITYIDYLFLGDYVDRGAHSLVRGRVLCRHATVSMTGNHLPAAGAQTGVPVQHPPHPRCACDLLLTVCTPC